MRILSLIIRKLKNRAATQTHIFQKAKALGLLLLINSIVFAGEKDFRGWKEGDYVQASIYSDLDWARKNYEEMEDPLRKQRYYDNFFSRLTKETIVWCNIESASSDALLVTGYFSSERTLDQVNRNESYDPRKIEPPRKFNIITSTNLYLYEWVKNSEPAWPKMSWWSLFKK